MFTTCAYNHTVKDGSMLRLFVFFVSVPLKLYFVDFSYFKRSGEFKFEAFYH